MQSLINKRIFWPYASFFRLHLRERLTVAPNAAGVVLGTCYYCVSLVVELTGEDLILMTL